MEITDKSSVTAIGKRLKEVTTDFGASGLSFEEVVVIMHVLYVLSEMDVTWSAMHDAINTAKMRDDSL